MKKLLSLIILLSFGISFAQQGPYNKRRKPVAPYNTELIRKTLDGLEKKSKAEECRGMVKYIINNATVIDSFKPDESTAISNSHLLDLDGYYYAAIIFTSSSKVYIYSTNKEHWRNYMYNGIYSAGKAFNEHIYPYKLCDY